jgi:acyl-CoA thioesterase I
VVTGKEKSEKSLVIALVGTSLTARGAWVNALPSALEPMVECPVCVVKFAQAGATSRWGVEIVDQVVQLRPDVAIIEFAINDASVHRPVSMVESGNNLTTIIRRLVAAVAGIRVYLMTMNPAIGMRGLMRPRLSRYYDLYPKLATSEGIWLIDNLADWRALSRADLVRALPDGAHPTPEFSIGITLSNVVRSLVGDFGAQCPLASGP